LIVPGGRETPGPDGLRILDPLLGPAMDGALPTDEGKNELNNPGKTGRTPLMVVRMIKHKARVIVAALFDRRPG